MKGFGWIKTVGQSVRTNFRGGRALGKKGSTVVAIAATAAVVATLGVTGAVAYWTDTEYDTASLSALDCSPTGAGFDTNAWGRLLSAEVLGGELDPIVALDGVEVSNTADADPTVSEPTPASAPAVQIGASNAWSSAISATVLDSITAGVLVNLFDAPDLGAYTQYGRAEAYGTSVGASGVLTSSPGGGISVGEPNEGTPGIGSIRLTELIDELLPGLGADAANLADLALTVGAVASSTQVDACDPMWDGLDPIVTRDYRIADLGLSLTSPLVGAIVTRISELLAAIDLDPTTEEELTLSIDVDAATLATLDDELLEPLLEGLDLGPVGLDFESLASISLDVALDLAPLASILTSTISDGAGLVSINLGTGEILVDLDALTGTLNGRAPNESIVFTAAHINQILGAIEDAVTGFLDVTLRGVLQNIMDAALVTAHIATTVGIALPFPFPTVGGVDLDIDIADLLGSLDDPDTPADEGGPFVTTALDLGVLSAIPGVGAILTGLVNALASEIVEPVVEQLVPALVDFVGDALDVILFDLVAELLDETDGVIPPLITGLEPLFTFVRELLDITVNVRPDAAPFPDAPAGATPMPGDRWYESAMRIAVLNLDPDPDEPDALIEVYLASSSAGPNTLR